MRVVCAWLAALIALSFAPAWGQVSREFDIKAAYLYNFGRYFDFPPAVFNDAKSPFVIGVIGNAQVHQVLNAATQGKMLQNRPIVVRRFDQPQQITPCQILYVSESLDDKVQAQINAQYANSPVVLVGDGEGYLPRAGTISFLLAENKVKLRVSKKSAQRAGLKPSSKLLQVAEVVE